MTEKIERFPILDGRPLTEAEREILTVISEECSELAIECNRVAVKISKMLRFGVEQTNPETLIKNDVEFCTELGHLHHMLTLAMDFPFYNSSTVSAGIAEKRRKLAKYLQHADLPFR